MITDEQKLKKIRDYAALGHTPGQIASLLRVPFERKDAFIDEFNRPNTMVYDAFMTGKATMDYNTNAELAVNAEKGDVEAIALLDKRIQEQKEAELLLELFGI